MTIDEAIVRHVDLLRFEAGVRQRVLAILTDMADDIARIIGTRELTEFRVAALNRLLKSITDTVGTFYQRVVLEATDLFAGMAVAEGSFTAKTATVADITVNVPPPKVMAQLATDSLIMGAPSRLWWARQSGDTVFRFMAAIRQGISQGESNSQILARLRGSRGDYGEFGVIRRNAEALVRSSIATISNAARLATYQANPDVIKGVQQVSTLDDRTTYICIAYDGGKWDLDGNPIMGTKLPFRGGPPRHWNCRSTLVSITKTYKELGLNIPEKERPRSSVDGPVITPSFSAWLATKDEAFQNRLLGKGRAELWRKGKISLQQLLDQSGRPLTLEQLRERS